MRASPAASGGQDSGCTLPCGLHPAPGSLGTREGRVSHSALTPPGLTASLVPGHSTVRLGEPPTLFRAASERVTAQPHSQASGPPGAGGSLSKGGWGPAGGASVAPTDDPIQSPKTLSLFLGVWSEFPCLCFVATGNGAAPEATAPVIVTAPGRGSVLAGSSEVTLECIANARPLEELRVSWKRNGVTLTRGLRSFGRRLTISTPTSADTGEYVCEAALAGSTAEPARAKAFLSITEPPYFTAEPESRIVVEVDETVDMACEAMDVAPAFTQLPADTTVTDGMTATLRCEVSGAPRPAITWRRDVAPAFTQLPADTTVTDGMTATLRCEVSGAPRPAITWRRGSHVLASGSVRIPRFMLLESGGLQISPVFIQDAGTYSCYAANTEGSLNASATLTVWNRTSIVTPPEDRVVIKGTTATLRCGATHDPRVSLRYVWRKDDVVLAPPSSSRIVVEPDGHAVLLSWVRPFDGNSPVLRYVVELSENNSPWKVHLADVGPEMTGVAVRGLTPARTYQFRVCAVNQVGKGQYSAETSRLMLPEEPPSAPPKNIVASGRTNQSIMVQWQPPPETEHNGVLRGYILRQVARAGRAGLSLWRRASVLLRYRLAGLPGEHQQRNISSPEVNYCLVTELIVWTQYEIQVAAYNGAGLGVFSRAVAEYTLQGVPTAPPQNVQAEAVNSTTIRFLWNPPPQQFINGINQGYKLLAWPADAPEAVTVVTIAPDFHGAHHGSVLCFGELWGAQGHRDGATPLPVSLVTTHEYKIQGLSSLTTYTIDVAALTAVGAGLATSSTISSGVPPELPGAPSNLVISNISPRSATLQFRPGYDGKTAISRWLVEGQVGAIGDEEEWVSLYEEENEPDAQTLEIPNLTPYTHYRFRMRQENVVGASPFSQSSRVIQTLQAPPDVAPSSVTVRTASETSLRLRWVPLPDSQYNGNPESVGYRVKYWRPDLRAPARAHVVSDRLERELTIEELEEWTEYEVQEAPAGCGTARPGPVHSVTRSTLAFPQELSCGLGWPGGGSMSSWSPLGAEQPLENQRVSGRGVPSAAPGNVSAVAVSSTQILLTWASVPEQDQNGLILGYKSALLTGLRKFVLYELQVLAFTRIGNGAASAPLVLERTKDDDPRSSHIENIKYCPQLSGSDRRRARGAWHTALSIDHTAHGPSRNPPEQQDVLRAANSITLTLGAPPHPAVPIAGAPCMATAGPTVCTMQRATAGPTACTVHGHSRNRWRTVQQAKVGPTVCTVHGHSRTYCTHRAWPQQDQLHAPCMATAGPIARTEHGHSRIYCVHCAAGHSRTYCVHRAWPQQDLLRAPIMATAGTAGALCMATLWDRA
ncbi:Protein sidekick-1 [Myotis davidii]|uniref:Protein sidekick-1 n=1 Tax=Myotis davidii TaxID=225400 RepID=L5LU54_MYODS|nr:Protein sidekick-1 [Myotis davidii]